MAIFPKIQSPCPYKSQLASVMDGDMCRMCQRQVFDLTDMDDAGRMAFMAGCKEEVCVSYRLPVRLAAAAVALAALATPMAAAAADAAAAPQEVITEVMVGGIKDLAHVKYIEDPADKAMAELPVVYEGDAGPAKAAAATPAADGKAAPSAAKDARPVSSPAAP